MKEIKLFVIISVDEDNKPLAVKAAKDELLASVRDMFAYGQLHEFIHSFGAEVEEALDNDDLKDG